MYYRCFILPGNEKVVVRTNTSHLHHNKEEDENENVLLQLAKITLPKLGFPVKVGKILSFCEIYT